jgi:hypothetical protein
MKAFYSTDDGANWTEITGIRNYPTIKTAMNSTSTCQITVVSWHDAGTQFADWLARDFSNIKVEDDATNLLFRGYLTKKVFTKTELTLYCEGISAKLGWVPFTQNYELASGLVSVIPSTTDLAGQQFILRCDADIDVNWSVPIAGNHFEEIDDTIASPDGDTTMIAADSTDDGLVETFSFEDITTAGITNITGIMIYVYGRNNATLGVENMLIDAKYTGGAFGVELIQKTMVFSSSYAWHSPTWSGLDLTEAEVNGLQIRFTAANPLDANEEQIISSVYAVITYTGENVAAIDVTDHNDVAFNWGTDVWKEDIDCGLLIVDNTTGNTTTNYDASALVSTNETSESGVATDTNVAHNGNQYMCQETGTTWDANVVFTVDGANLDSTTIKLKKLTIKFQFSTLGINIFNPSFKLEINKDGSYYTLATIPFTYVITRHNEEYVIEDTDTELAKYFNKTGDNYDELKGIRITFYNPYSANKDCKLYIDLLEVEIEHNPYDIGNFMEEITDHGASWLECSGTTFSETGISVGDAFRIGVGTTTILDNICEKAEVGISITTSANFTKYSARWFKGTTCLDALKSIILLEGAMWYEDFDNDCIVIVKPADFEDSGVNLSEADYGHDWEYEDESNTYNKVEVFGKAALLIHAESIDETVTSLMTKIFVDETITTNADAKDIADAQLAIYSVKRPSIKLSLNGVNSSIIAGQEVTLVMARPTVASKNYVVRAVERTKFGGGIKTVIWCGLGQTPAAEGLANTIKNIAHIAHKAHTDRLTSTPVGTGASISWSDVGGGEAAVNALIATHTADDDAHHDPFESTFAIGIANKRWQTFNIRGNGNQSTRTLGTETTITNFNGTDTTFTLPVTLPYEIVYNGTTYNLTITDTRIGLQDADGGDYINRIRWIGWSDHDSSTTEIDDLNNKTTVATHTYGHADFTVGGVYKWIGLSIATVLTNAGDFNMSFAQFEYYYA